MNDNVAMQMSTEINKEIDWAINEIPHIPLERYRLAYLRKLCEVALKVYSDYTYTLYYVSYKTYTANGIQTFMNNELLLRSVNMCFNLDAIKAELAQIQEFYQKRDPTMEFEYHGRKSNIYESIKKVLKTIVDLIFRVKKVDVRSLLYKRTYRNVLTYRQKTEPHIQELLALDKDFEYAEQILEKYKKSPRVVGEFTYGPRLQYNMLAYINEISETTDPRILHFVLYQLKQRDDPKLKNDIALLQDYVTKLPL